MKPEIKTKWLKALRSGDYKQTTKVLKDGNSYCCLGVLCQVHSLETKTEWNGSWYLGKCDILPKQVIEWAGVEDVSPVAGDFVLATLNDNGTTFKEIADLIEKEL